MLSLLSPKSIGQESDPHCLSIRSSINISSSSAVIIVSLPHEIIGGCKIVTEPPQFVFQSQKAPVFVIEDGFPRCVKNSLDSTGFEPIHRKHQCTALRFGNSIVKISAQILADITEMVYSVKVSNNVD